MLIVVKKSRFKKYEEKLVEKVNEILVSFNDLVNRVVRYLK